MSESLPAQYAGDLLAAAIDPRKRLFLGYLAAALAVALVWLRLRDGLGPAAAIRRILAREIWCGESARADYKLALINHAPMLGLAPALLAQMTVSASVFYALHDVAWASPGMGAALPAWAVLGAFTVALFALDDLSRYVVHRAMHRWPVLWAFHKVHHSARTLTPVTVYRTHPVEGVLFALRSALVQGTVIAAFVFAFGDRVDLVAVLGVNVLLFAFNAAGSNLRHSHVAFGYPDGLERFLMSPAQHQLHHSSDPRHHDCNFGVALALWDWLGGTLHRSRRGEALRFGLSPRTVPGEHGLARLYLAPFAEVHRLARARIRKVAGVLARGFRGTAPAGNELHRRVA